jgi:hypothetical protein
MFNNTINHIRFLFFKNGSFKAWPVQSIGDENKVANWWVMILDDFFLKKQGITWFRIKMRKGEGLKDSKNYLWNLETDR